MIMLENELFQNNQKYQPTEKSYIKDDTINEELVSTHWNELMRHLEMNSIAYILIVTLTQLIEKKTKYISLSQTLKKKLQITNLVVRILKQSTDGLGKVNEDTDFIINSLNQPTKK